MEEYRSPEEHEDAGTEEQRFILLRWWDRVYDTIADWIERWRESRADRPQKPVPPAPSDEEIARWVALLARPEDPTHGRAVDELVVIGRPAVPMLIAALQSDSWVQAFRAVEALGLIGDRRAVRHLTRLLRHPNSNVRWGAAEALGRLQSRWARGPLRRSAQNDENRTSWGETVSEAAERAVASIDETWVSRLINVFQILFYLALCVLVVYAAFYIVRQALEQRERFVPTPTATATVTATATATPTATPLPTFVPVPATIRDTANVRDRPDSATGARIAVLHQGDEIWIQGGRVDGDGAWWYFITLAKINNPATLPEALADGTYGWIHSSLVAGVESPELAPTVGAIETMRAQVATPTPLGSSLDLTTPTPILTNTVAPSVTVTP
jgi:hypothetical protein